MAVEDINFVRYMLTASESNLIFDAEDINRLRTLAGIENGKPAPEGWRGQVQREWVIRLCGEAMTRLHAE